MSEHINFSLMQSNPSVVHESLLGQDMSSPLVSGGINFVNPATPPIQNNQCLVVGGQSIPISTQNQHTPSLINLNHAPNANSPLMETCMPHAMHSPSGSISNESQSCNLKQSAMMQVPMNPNEGTQNTYKPPMKGQIIKTPDQRLMFVTEVNGGRVGYLIQQPKQTIIPQQAQTTVPQIQTTENVLNQHHDNRGNVEGSTMNIGNTETINIDKVKCNTSGAINFTLGGNKDMKVTEPLLKTDIKSLREKLLNLRNPLNMKNQLNLKSSLTFPPMAKPEAEENVSADTSMVIDDEDKPMSPSAQLNSTSLSNNSPNQSYESIADDEGEDVLDDETFSPKRVDLNNDEILEEEGQEIEFSENDLVVDFDDSLTENLSFQVEEDNNGEGTLGTDNEDSNQGSVSPIENQQVQSELPNKTAPKRRRIIKKLKVPKEALQNEHDVPDGKSKKKGKSKVKKKKDNRKPKKPMKSYQLYFREVQKVIRTENPQLTFGEISREVSKKWEILDEAEKKKYHESHEVAKLEYDEKMKAYKELIAMEKLASPDSPHSDLDNETVPKKANKPVAQKKKVKGKKRKLADKVPEPVPEIVPEPVPEPIEAKEPNEESDHSAGEYENSFEMKDVDVEPPSEGKVPVKKLNMKKISKTNDEYLGNPPSSPSLPSSASSDADEEDSESAINRIREKAAELHKYLKQQRFVVTQKKSKQPEKKARSGKTDDKVDKIVKKPEDSDIAEDVEVNSVDSKLEIGTEEECLKEEVKVEEFKNEEDNMDQEEDLQMDHIKDAVMEVDVPSTVDSDLDDDELTKTMDTDDSEDDKPLRPIKTRKRRSKIKKSEEIAGHKDENGSSRLRRRKPVKKVDETPNDDSDEEVAIIPRRRKSIRKKKVIDTTKSDSEEESKDEEEEANTIIEKETDEVPEPEPEPERLPEPDNEEISNSDKQSIDEKESTKVELPVEDVKETDISPPPTTQVEQPKPEIATPDILKNTFRIPKKSGPNKENGLLVMHGPRICIRQTCDKPAVTSKERGGQYCGNDCLVLYCREVFESWVVDQEVDLKNKT